MQSEILRIRSVDGFIMAAQAMNTLWPYAKKKAGCVGGCKKVMRLAIRSCRRFPSTAQLLHFVPYSPAEWKKAKRHGASVASLSHLQIVASCST